MRTSFSVFLRGTHIFLIKEDVHHGRPDTVASFEKHDPSEDHAKNERSSCLLVSRIFKIRQSIKSRKWSDNISIILERDLINAGEALHDAQRSKDPRSGLTKTINHLQVTTTHFEKRAICTHFESTDPRRYLISAEALAQAALCYALIATISAGLEEQVLALKYAEYFKVNFMLYLADIDLSGQIPKREEIGYHGLFLLSFVTRLLPIRNSTEEKLAERFLALCLRNDDHFIKSFTKDFQHGIQRLHR